MYNTTTIVGHLGQDCTTKIIEGGRSLTQFSIAHTESWKDGQGQKQERTTWFNCSYFTHNTPGVAEYLRKGALILVSGAISARAYLDQQQRPAASLDLLVDTIKLINTPRRDEQPATSPLPHPDAVLRTNPTPSAPGDDLPF